MDTAKTPRTPATPLLDAIKRTETAQKRLLDNLDKAISDHELIADGWTLILAVDYHIVYEFAWGHLNLLSVLQGAEAQGASNRKRQRFITRRTAMAHLLGRLDHASPAVLLPPHAIELRNSLARVMLTGTEQRLRVQLMKEMAKAGILDDRERALAEALHVFYESHDVNDPLPPELYESLQRLVDRRKYQDILYAAAGFSRRGVAVIRDLLTARPPRLVLRPKLDIDVDSVAEGVWEAPSSMWYEALSAVRPHEHGANFIDAKAIELVLALNRALEAAKSRTFVCLVSDADSMDIVLNPWFYDEWRSRLPREIDRIEPHSLLKIEPKIHRRLDTMTLYLRASMDSTNARDVVAELRRLKGIAIPSAMTWPMLEDVRKQCPSDCAKCPRGLKVKCSRVRSELDKQRARFVEFLSWGAVARRGPYLDEFRELESRENDFRRAVVSFVKFLHGRHDEFERKIGDAARESERTLEEARLTFGSEIIGMANESVKRLAGGAGLRAIPFDIEVQNEKSRLGRLLRRLQRAGRVSSSLLQARNISTDVLRMSGDERLGGERFLLMALVFYYGHQLGLVGDVCDSWRHCGGGDDVRCALLECLVLHQLAVERESMELYEIVVRKCANACDAWPEDARVWYVRGAAVLRAQARGMEVRVDVGEPKRFYSRALELCERGRTGGLLKGSILNGLAFAELLACARSGEVDRVALSEAERFLERMEREVARTEWGANLWDTYGVFCFARSVVEIAGEAVRWAKEAVGALRTALDMAKTGEALSWEIDEITKHLTRAKERLEEVTGAAVRAEAGRSANGEM
jgi:hypothetical protein